MFNPWFPKLRREGDSAKVRCKMTPQEKSIFQQKLTNLDKFFKIENSDDFTIYNNI